MFKQLDFEPPPSTIHPNSGTIASIRGYVGINVVECPLVPLTCVCVLPAVVTSPSPALSAFQTERRRRRPQGTRLPL